MGRAPCCDKANVKRGPWSPEEDAALRSYIQKHGTGGNWIALPRKAGLKRCGKSCRLRWLNYLRPDIKHGGFTEEEDSIIFAIYSKMGSRWSIIASYLPGRTDNDVKNYWNTKLKKKLIATQKNLLTTVTSGVTNQIIHNLSQTSAQLPPLSLPPAALLATIETACQYNSSEPLATLEINSVLTQNCSKLYSEPPPFTVSCLTHRPNSSCCINDEKHDEVTATPSPIAMDKCSGSDYLDSAAAFSSDDRFMMELGLIEEPDEALILGYGCQGRTEEMAPYWISGLDGVKAASETIPQGLFQSYRYYS